MHLNHRWHEANVSLQHDPLKAVHSALYKIPSRAQRFHLNAGIFVIFTVHKCQRAIPHLCTSPSFIKTQSSGLCTFKSRRFVHKSFFFTCLAPPAAPNISKMSCGCVSQFCRSCFLLYNQRVVHRMGYRACAAPRWCLWVLSS